MPLEFMLFPTSLPKRITISENYLPQLQQLKSIFQEELSSAQTVTKRRTILSSYNFRVFPLSTIPLLTTATWSNNRKNDCTMTDLAASLSSC